VTLTANSRLTLNERLDIGGDIFGAFSLTKDGAGLLNMSAAKTYSGGFILGGGEVLAQHNSVFGTGTLRLNGGTLARINHQGKVRLISGGGESDWRRRVERKKGFGQFEARG
jgi:autotransporter-associated beta strand protein